MAAAIQQVTANAQALIRDEIELAKLEVTTKARNGARGAAIGAAAGIFVLGATLLILQGLAWLVAMEVFPDNIYLGFFGVALLLLLLAAVAGFVAGTLV